MAEGRSLLVQAAQAGPPCVRCAHYSAPFCGHLAYTSQSYSPVDGALSVSIAVPAKAARADDGLCGPEATLFEPDGRLPTPALIGLVLAYPFLMIGAACLLLGVVWLIT